ncbi:ClbS/DfsB family four-helix bundle protein [Brucellaceae bacterium C25G]
MSVPTDKAELLKAIDVNFEKLILDLKQVPLNIVDEKTLTGHVKDTTISVANLTAYLVGWNELVLKWLDQDAAGQIIDFPETGFKWNELGRLAQKFYVDYEDTTYPELLKRLECAKSRIVSIIENYSNDVLYGQPWYEKWTMGRMIQFNTSSPYANARIRLRKWLKAQSV